MKRRQFVAAGLATASAMTPMRLFAQAVNSNRAAVVLGVDKPGNLPKLKAAASGAASVANWLSGEGFEVKLMTDGSQPVKVSDVFDAVAALVRRGTLEQLVLYFAGHGFISAYSEFWLLSGAPDNPNEAVSVQESIFLARQTSIPNVVIISDACRSKSTDLEAERVRGSLIFPNNPARPHVIADVDLFYATLVGDPSWEASLQDSTSGFAGIFTATFLDAYRHPDQSMVNRIRGKDVVPNGKLKPYLLREVPRRAQAASIRITQHPDVQVVSGDSTYIGTVSTSQRQHLGGPLPATISALAGETLARVQEAPAGSHQVPSSMIPTTLRGLAEESGFTASTERIVSARGQSEELPWPTCFAVSGAHIASVRPAPGISVKLVNESQDRTLLEVNLMARRAGLVSVRFHDASGTVLVALENYIGSVVVDAQGVSNVSYVPSRNNPMAGPSLEPRIAALHAVIATSARFGVFRIEGGRKNNEQAIKLANSIRVMKGYDATLGIYAAYAYAQADIDEQVKSVSFIMRSVYGTEFFDLEMLAGELSGKQLEPSSGVLPLFPMLSQGWNLLRVKNVRLPPGVFKARDHLRPSLWTTFDASGMEIVESAIPWVRT